MSNEILKKMLEAEPLDEKTCPLHLITLAKIWGNEAVDVDRLDDMKEANNLVTKIKESLALWQSQIER